ncbi:MAG TPA: hypothetical protein QGF02_04790 [Candidatus Babeliales bacterium]|nr:hypothetical protein [Candidatus Babeliales bacterium]
MKKFIILGLMLGLGYQATNAADLCSDVKPRYVPTGKFHTKQVKTGKFKQKKVITGYGTKSVCDDHGWVDC